MPRATVEGVVVSMKTVQISFPSRISRINLTDVQALALFGLVVTVFHILTNGQYGFHRDELDIILNAQYPAWGYVAYPPLTSFLARIEYAVFGFSLVGLRLLPALGAGVAAALSGWMARDMGGSRRAQLAAAAAVAIAPVAMVAGTLIQYMSFDYLWWVLISFSVVRLLKTEDPRWWLGVGAAIGLGMMTKYTLAFFVVGLAAGVLLTTNRRYLRSQWLWAGAGLATLIFLPNLIWQLQHGFISLEFLASIHARDISWGRTQGFLPEQLYVPANPATIPLWVGGLYFALVSKDGRKYRILAWMFLVTFALLLVTQGRSYYLAPAYPMLLALGAARRASWFERLPWQGRQINWNTGWTPLIVGALIAVLVSKPVTPINSTLFNIAAKIDGNLVEMIGWPDLVAQVGQIWETIPAEERPRTVILASNYGEMGALYFYSRPYNLPPLISGGNSAWERGYGDPPPTTAIVVGFERSDAMRIFSSCRLAGTVKNRYGVKNEESSWHTSLFVCRGPVAPWDQMWPEMRWFQ